MSLPLQHDFLRTEFANIRRRLSDFENKIDKLSARCDKLPAMSNDLTACRREVADVRHVVDNLAAAGSRRELEANHASQYTTAAEGNGQCHGQWPELPVSSDDEWDVMLALVVTEESLPQSTRPFSNHLARRIVAHARNARAPIKAAIRCVIQERWAAECMSMLGWRIVNGKKVYGFKAFTHLRPFIVATMNEVS